MKVRIGRLLRKWADRIDPDHSFRRMTSLGLTMEVKSGWTLNKDGRGIQPWYVADDYDKAYDEATLPPRQIDWRTMSIKERPRG